jgi:hypothetical protein
MRVDPKAHRERALLIHRLCPDFDLLDVWRLPAEARMADDTFERFLRVFPLLRGDHAQRAPRIVRFLMGVRHALLNTFGLQDEPTRSLPIPGCNEQSIRERMTQTERERFELAPALARGSFVPVYRTSDERLDELSNSTVHALLHTSWVSEHGTQCAYLAVYAKPRGRFGRIYLVLISPFRHWLVYPTLMKMIERAWQLRAVEPRST